VDLYITAYDGYPYSQWQGENEVILIEGMIYNQSQDQIEVKLKEISRCFSEDGDYQALVRAFVESADGDFIAEIWDNQRNRLLLFNDYWGRLPLYHYCMNELCGISREIKNLLSFVPEIELNKTSLVEFLYFERPLGNKTLFENIYRLDPACMMIVQVGHTGLASRILQIVDINFDLKAPLADRSKSIEYLKELFLQSVQWRVQTLRSGGFKIAADLSGGFDSRALLGGLEKYTHNGVYCVQKLNTNDQRKWGQALFESMDSPGKLYTAAPDHSYEINNLGSFVYQYDCMGNYSVAFNSHQVVKTLKQLVPDKAARFMGFGASDFLRKPITSFRKSVIYGMTHGFYFYSNISLSQVCRFVGVNFHEYHQVLQEYLNTYPEQTAQGQLRRLYFEYHNRYINAAEDYCRKFFWTVCPFWGIEFVRAIVEHVPLAWAGFRYFTHFMKVIDPRLLQTPIFGKNVDLNSDWSITILEAKARLQTWIKTSLPAVHYLYNDIQARLNCYDEWQKIEPFLQEITCSLTQSVLPPGNLGLNAGNVIISRRYLTLLLYLCEVEKRYRGKIKL
jgi:hypothetical protein